MAKLVFIVAAACLALLPTTALALVADTAICSREALRNATDRYVATQSAGNKDVRASALGALLAPNATYTENERPVDVGAGVLARPLKIDHVISLHDTVGCATFTELVVNNSVNPYVIGTRMLLSPGSGGGNTSALPVHVTAVESIVTRPGDWLFNASGYLHYESLEDWSPIPKDKQDTRAVIKAAGDAYFDRFDNASASVPWGTPCARLEGGASTGARDPTGNTCNLGLPSTIRVTDRRYVVDEEMGAVDIFLGFPGLDRTQGTKPMPDSHLFRVEGGRIRYIHTVSSCVVAGCGVNMAIPPPSRVRL